MDNNKSNMEEGKLPDKLSLIQLDSFEVESFNTGELSPVIKQDDVLKEIAEANKLMAQSANVTDPGSFTE
jgi:hypothetical protein